MIIVVKQTMLYFKRVAIFRDKHYPNRSVCDALRFYCFNSFSADICDLRNITSPVVKQWRLHGRNITSPALNELISQCSENDMFSIEMDLCMQFRSSKGLEQTLTFKISLKRILTSSSVIEYLSNELICNFWSFVKHHQWSILNALIVFTFRCFDKKALSHIISVAFWH